MNTVLYSSISNEWATPLDLFISLDLEFSFTLDPCASDLNHKCSKYYTVSDNGLSKSWRGESVFCNPPYGKDIKLWVKKCHDEFFSNGAKCVVLLIPARTDTAYFHDFIYKFAEIRFLRGRLHFNGSKNPAPFPSMVCVFR